MRNYDKIIVKLFYTTRLRKTIISKFEINICRYSNIYEYLCNRYSNEFISIRETLFRLYHNLEEPKRCFMCGKQISYLDSTNFCSDTCKQSHKIQTYKENFINKYGVDNPAKVETFKTKAVLNTDYEKRQQKIKNTCIERYGVDNPLKLQKSISNSHSIDVISKQKESRKRTNIEKYGVVNPMQNKQVQEHIKNTCIEKYGVDNVFKSNEIKEKIKNTHIKKYGKYFVQTPEAKENLSKIAKQRYIDNPNLVKENIDKAKETCLNMYGVENWSQNEDNRKYISYMLSSDEIQKKIINTSYEHFGVSNPAKSSYIQEKIYDTCIERYGQSRYTATDVSKKNMSELMSSEWMQNHRHEIMKEHNSFNKSSKEIEAYHYILEKFPDTMHQYRSDKYPFNCDFYIPSIYTYIEYQGHWTHGGHPYDSEQDKEKLEIWESKNTKFYDNAIYTWTVRDPKKRQIAKENNLNFIEFWNIDEVKSWLEMSIL